MDYRPEVRAEDAHLWKAWTWLHPLRPNSGWVLEAIPVSEMVAWCEAFDLTGEDRIELIEVILRVDADYRTWAKDQKEPDANPASSDKRK